MKTSVKALAMMLMLTGTLGLRSVSDTRPRSEGVADKLVEKTRVLSVEGVIDSLSASRRAIILNGMAVYLSANAVITAGDKIVSFDVLGPGMKVRAYGTLTPTTATATKIELVTK